MFALLRLIPLSISVRIAERFSAGGTVAGWLGCRVSLRRPLSMSERNVARGCETRRRTGAVVTLTRPNGAWALVGEATPRPAQEAGGHERSCEKQESL